MKNKLEDQVIEAAREGLGESLTPSLENLLRLVYRAGYKQAKIDAMEREQKSELGYSRIGLGNV
ncbi:hypothetical protein EBT25_05210 [bacterium]|jgi:predicted house-cleaning noncanonical NTP pyrophosphatase (MazG superfamily)|nr:hypothetical protein [bacterium]